ncbi:shikimate dehydrogenase [Pseudaminobacter arsenicus]|uniref:Shikimate dehydrogenase n=1 Tax=Borborobacter arsenicus TaxID=1851146 RepID=A0A432V1N7_9HYPH|nr:shikimate dehydrogenase [Pseudaminobacter arsenicus]RUM96025.1 shikimate dehydrogenase [Pseudaminobacter arsenicus]
MARLISGKTRVCAILADPVGHVRTPQALNALFERHAIDAVMVPFEVAPVDLVRTVDGLRAVRNLAGVVVTVPHKSAISALCDRVSDRARLAGAVNVIRREADGRLSGDLLDGEGFAAGLELAGAQLAGKRVFLAGAGGGASAIAFAAAERGVVHLTISNRSRDKANALAARLASGFPKLGLATEGGPENHDIAVNATSLGLKGNDPLPFDPDRLSPGTLVAEVVMQPEVTPLLLSAAERGLPTHPGKWMLEAQLSEILRFLVPDVAPVRVGAT